MGLFGQFVMPESLEARQRVNSQKVAFSYIRFSNERQQLGDSLRRQVALAEDYAQQHGLSLDTHSYRDMGISAYRGRNAIEGKLATFLRAVDGAHVPSDCFLLVESLDRLSRHDVDEALELLLSIVRRGVTVVTLTDRQVYSSESMKRDHGISLIISITIMMRAHEESATKSRRNKEAWAARTARGGVLTKLCPAWLRYSDGKWLVVEAKAKVVRRIYELALHGYGAMTIQRILNASNVPTMKSAKFWTPGLVTKILSSPSVYGTLDRQRAKADPIPGYYPAVVPREIFDKVRVAARARNWKGQGPTRAKPSNLFVGVSFCGGCGSRMLVTTGTGDRYYLRCSRAHAKAGCDALPVLNTWAEEALFEELLAPPVVTEFEKASRSENARRVSTLVDQMAAAQADRDALIRAVLGDKMQDDTARRLEDVESSIKELQVRLVVEKHPTAPVENADAEQARHLCAALAGGRTLAVDKEALREKLATRTRRMFVRMVFDVEQPHVRITYESGRQAILVYVRPETSFERIQPAFVPRYLRPATRPGRDGRIAKVKRTAWLRRFAVRLQSLNDSVRWNSTMFNRLAQAAYLDAFDLEPEEAADIHGPGIPPTHPGMPEN